MNFRLLTPDNLSSKFSQCGNDAGKSQPVQKFSKVDLFVWIVGNDDIGLHDLSVCLDLEMLGKP